MSTRHSLNAGNHRSTAANTKMNKLEALIAKGTANLPRNNDLLKSQRMSANLRRQLVDLPAHVQVEAERLMRRNDAAVSSKDFSVTQGVSMEFINGFYNRFKNGDEFKQVNLYIHVKSGRTINWKNKKTIDGDALCTVHTGRIADEEERFKIDSLKKKRRLEWTVADITNFCIYPELMEGQDQEIDVEEADTEMKTVCYLDKIGDGNPERIGESGIGYYILTEPSVKFSELIEALQEYYKDEITSPYDTFVYLEMFGLDLGKIRRANEFRDKAPKLFAAYREFVRKGIPDLVTSFDKRFVFLESWEKPRLLMNLWCVWQLYAMERTNYKVISNQYDDLSSLVFDKQDNNLFSLVELLDPTRMAGSEMLKNIFEEEISKQETGLSHIKKVLSDGLTRWFMRELEDNLRLLGADDPDKYTSINEDMYTKVSEDLFKAGKFNFWRSRNALSKRYLDDALKFYTYFELELWLERNRDLNATAMEMNRPSHFKRGFVRKLLIGLINVRLFLGRVLARQTLYTDALSVIKDAENASRYLEGDAKERSDFEIECKLALADIYTIKGENKAAISEYRHAELTWKIAPDKKKRVVKICFELGVLLRGVKKFGEAQKILRRALADYRAYLKVNNEPQDVLEADILMEIARTEYRGGKNDAAQATFEKAERIVNKIIGYSNVRVAKIKYFLGNCLQKQGRSTEALDYYDIAIHLMKQCLGRYRTEVATIYRAKGATYRSLVSIAKKNGEEYKREEYKKLELDSLEKALETISKIMKPDSVKKQYLDIASYSIYVADTYKSMNNFSEAHQYYQDALDIRSRELGAADKSTVAARNLLFTNKMKMT